MADLAAPDSASPLTPISPKTVPDTLKSSYFPAESDLSIIPPFDTAVPHTDASQFDPSREVQTRSKSGSVSTISFKISPDNASEPVWGKPKHRKDRIKSSSPPPAHRFKPHVSFDNFSGDEPTENNAVSFTLNKRHTGYQYKKRSRTFMVGIDEHEYSNTALKWMLNELVDDGDEIVCVRVIDPDSKIISTKSLERETYKDEAYDLMEKIQDINASHRAISIVLEFAVGKLHTTFQTMINLYEPAMLIVGTKGRSLGGLQGLMANRSSFSKWCLQYSPIPVVVVRPDDKREKKRLKRANDPTRRNYALLLSESGAEVHETNAKPGGSFEKAGSLTLTSDQEAHAVAAALGLPAKFDPSQKPVFVPGKMTGEKRRSDGNELLRRRSYSPDSSPTGMVVPLGSKVRTDSPSVSDDEEGDDSEDDFEITPGGALLVAEDGEAVEDAVVKKERLHAMEVGEAAALAGRKASVSSAGSTEDADGVDDVYSPTEGMTRPFVEYFIV